MPHGIQRLAAPCGAGSVLGFQAQPIASPNGCDQTLEGTISWRVTSRLDVKKKPVARNVLKARMEERFRAYRRAVEPFFASLDAGISKERFEPAGSRIETTPSPALCTALRFSCKHSKGYS